MWNCRFEKLEKEKYMAHILIVDDEEKMRHLLSIMLSRRGYAIEQAANGLEALAMIENALF